MTMEADAFVRWIVKSLNVKCIIVGDDFRFGHNRAGDHRLLSAMAGELGYELIVTEAADATELLTAGVTSALTYYGADVSVAQNDSNVVTASAQGAQVGNTAQETEQANEASQTPTAAQTCGYTNLGMSAISSGNLNIRQEASTDSEVIGILTNHNACELLEDAGEWYKVTSGKVTGYVNKQYLVTGDEAEAIAEQEIKTVATVNTGNTECACREVNRGWMVLFAGWKFRGIHG